MKRGATQEPAPRITRRGLMLLGLQAGVVGALGWRMRDLQIVQNEHFALLAEENRVNIRLIPPARGQILDRAGRLMAGNRQNYRISMVREQARRPRGGAGAAGDDRPAAAPTCRRGRSSEMADAQRLRAGGDRRAPELGGRRARLGQRPGPARRAAGGGPQPLLSRRAEHQPRHRLRRPGLARATSPSSRTPTRCCRSRASRSARPASRPSSRPTCAARPARSRIEVSAAGRVMRELGRVEGTPGKDLELTIDLALQNYAMRRMAGESAAAAVIDVTNGDILALASAPGFDAEQLRLRHQVGRVERAPRTTSTARSTTRRSPAPTRPARPSRSAWRSPRSRRAWSAPATGSTAAARPALGGRRFHCWKRGGHGRVALRASLAQSCDCYYYEMGRRLGPDRISAMAHILGLGVAHDLPIPAVSAGNMPDAAWKKAKRKESWTTGDSFNYGIGQGFTLASPLQLAVMTARVASGTAVKPRIIRKIDGVRGAGRAGRAARRSPSAASSWCATACSRSRTAAPPAARASPIRR